MRKIDIRSEWLALAAAALLGVGYSIYLSITYANQPPLDAHSFRQTQTALTSYWFIEQGFKLAYETPVAGAPWSIPFELPIYQMIVAYLAETFHLNLDATGRIVSHCFLLLTIIPTLCITKRLNLPSSTSLYFIAILFSMPVYVYWGRSFMIETAAVFFGITSIKFFLDYLLGGRTILAALFFIIFATLGILQKLTTALPILFILSIVFLIAELKKYSHQQPAKLIKSLIITGSIFLIPISIGLAWVIFTDKVKLENPLGQQLASSAISAWNWGTLHQRISPDLWVKVIWERVFASNLGALLGASLLITTIFLRVEQKIKLIALTVIILGALPFFIFTNLHIVHDYYQTANVLFFAYGIALSLAIVIAPKLGKRAAVLALLGLMLSNYIALGNGYLPQIKQNFSKSNKNIAIGNILNREISPEMQFIAFGNDWSSTFTYIAERKSFTVPFWFKSYDQVIANPEDFLEKGLLGGIVSCTNKNPTITQLFDWIRKNEGWLVGKTHDCLVIVPERTITASLLSPLECQGSIDSASTQLLEGRNFIIFSGWLARRNDINQIPDNVILKISDNSNATLMHIQTLKIPRPDVNKYLKIDDFIDTGFSRIIENTLKPGTYTIELIERIGNEYRSCDIRKTFEIK